MLARSNLSSCSEAVPFKLGMSVTPRASEIILKILVHPFQNRTFVFLLLHNWWLRDSRHLICALKLVTVPSSILPIQNFQIKCKHPDLQLPEFWEVNEGLWVDLVERVPLEVELHQLGTLLEETGARDAGDPVLAD